MENTPDLSNYYAIHRGQRTDLARLVDAIATSTEADRGGAGRLHPLARWAKGFTHELHTHHSVEDDIFFPAVLGRVPAAAAVVEGLDADHQVVARLLEGLAPAVAALAGERVAFEPAKASALAAAVELRDLLARHLDVEDQDLLPLFYRHFTAEEYDGLHDRAQRSVKVRSMSFAVPWFVACLDDAAQEKVRAGAPLPLRVVYALTRPRFDRLVSAAFDGVPAAAGVRS
jgi:hemerythrin-like domain-containing protein